MISFEESGLTRKQYDYCLEIIKSDKSKGYKKRAYESVYSADNMTDNSISIEVSRLSNNPKISQVIDSGMNEIAQQVIVKRKYDIEKLCDLVEEAMNMARIRQEPNVILRAVDLLAKLHRMYDGDGSDANRDIKKSEAAILKRFRDRIKTDMIENDSKIIDITPQ